jgi:predicted nucleic acid-binding protein
MRALLDVNVLIALLDSDHSLHVAASTWFNGCNQT